MLHVGIFNARLIKTDLHHINFLKWYMFILIIIWILLLIMMMKICNDFAAAELLLQSHYFCFMWTSHHRCVDRNDQISNTRFVQFRPHWDYFRVQDHPDEWLSQLYKQKQQQIKTNLKHEWLRACYNIMIYHFTGDDDLKRFFRI